MRRAHFLGGEFKVNRTAGGSGLTNDCAIPDLGPSQVEPAPS